MLQLGQHRPGHAAVAVFGHREHALDLGPAVAEVPPAAAAGRRAVEPGDQEQPLRRQEIGDVDGRLVPPAVPEHVLALDQLDQRQRVGLVQPGRRDLDAHRHRQAWSTGPMPGAQREAARDRAGDVLLGRGHRLRQRRRRARAGTRSRWPACSRCRGCAGCRSRGARSRGPRRPSVSSRSTASPARWPPLISTQRGPSASTASAARRRSRLASRPDAGELRDLVQVRGDDGGDRQQPARAPRRRRRRPAAGRRAWRRRPGRRPPARRPGRAARRPLDQLGGGQHAGLDRLARRCRRRTLRNWARTASTGSSQQPCTPSEFCAVTAVSTLMPCTPSASIVFRSAWMPAPPPESEPATVSTRGGAAHAATVPRLAPSLAEVVPAARARPGRAVDGHLRAAPRG